MYDCHMYIPTILILRRDVKRFSKTFNSILKIFTFFFPNKNNLKLLIEPSNQLPLPRHIND